MKRDWGLYTAIGILIVLVMILLFISLEKQKQVDYALEQIRKVQTTPFDLPKVVNGKTPQLGVDYFVPEVQNGKNGLSAYDIAVREGFEGSQSEWLESLKGKDAVGKQGESAYDIAHRLGFGGTEQEWLNSLVGKAGRDVSVSCESGIVMKRYQADDFMQATNIRCEATNE